MVTRYLFNASLNKQMESDRSDVSIWIFKLYISTWIFHLIYFQCKIEEKLLQASLILEAFGNAKTVKNDNASRFVSTLEEEINVLGIFELPNIFSGSIHFSKL